MNIISIHADGAPHRRWTGVWPTASPGAYIVPPGALVHEASGRTWASDYPVVAFFWPKVYFQVFMLLKENVTDYYCNMITPAFIARDVIYIDLDLDVTVMDGQIDLLDEQEFRARQFAYPAAWRSAVQQASQWLVQQAHAKTGIFHPATGERWRIWLSSVLD
ncbi:DUF402 domain-containing protein [Alicyclobacillus suci]|uniref:DUF402 domain-containing protein n=1 Tax=Alicyclobacillus suci TaxID=2816080 RepID=UPI001A8FC115|nr:DUF402 domain-containing protein [Alicyclobacillus suci]